MLKLPPMEILKPQLHSSCSCPSSKAHVNCAFDLQDQYFTLSSKIPGLTLTHKFISMTPWDWGKWSVSQENRISMCKIVSSCIFFSDGLNESLLAMWLLDPARSEAYEAIKASNLRDVRTSSASNTTLHYKVNSINATYTLKAHYQMRRKSCQKWRPVEHWKWPFLGSLCSKKGS